MDLTLSESELAFQAEARKWLRAHVPAEPLLRALTRLRFPGGVPPGTRALETGGTTPLAAGSFYEKNAPVGTPDWVRRQPVRTSEGVIDYVVADETATLVWLANLAALELHTPQWRVGRDGRPADPDRLVVDLDPGPGVGLAECSVVAGVFFGLSSSRVRWRPRNCGTCSRSSWWHRARPIRTTTASPAPGRWRRRRRTARSCSPTSPEHRSTSCT